MGHAFQKGMPRAPNAGRRKGTPNRVNSAKEVLDRLGVNPLEKLAEFLDHEDPYLSMSAAKEMCRYIYPTLKSVEVTPTTDPFKDMSDEEKLEKARTVVALLEERINK